MKSTFDKLFESVMSEDDQNELEALGIDAGEEGDVDVEETEEVTITLDRDMAEKLCDLLKEACGGDDDMEAEDGEHHSAEDYEGEEGFSSFEEAEEDNHHNWNSYNGHDIVAKFCSAASCQCTHVLDGSINSTTNF